MEKDLKAEEVMDQDKGKGTRVEMNFPAHTDIFSISNDKMETSWIAKSTIWLLPYGYMDLA